MNKWICIVISILLVASIVKAEDWIIQTVDSEGDVGVMFSLPWTDSLGIPHIVYQSHSIAYHTYWTGSGWSKSQIGAVAGGQAIDALVDSTGVLHLLRSAGYSTVYYMYLDGEGWHGVSIGLDFQGTSLFSLALDPHGKPHIAYVAYGWLYHVYIDTLDQEWKRDTVSVGGEAYLYCSMGIDSAGRIYVAYFTSGGHLKLAYYDGNAWGIQLVDIDTVVGLYCDLILDENGVPHIAYYDATNTRLKYATWSSTPKTGNKSQE